MKLVEKLNTLLSESTSDLLKEIKKLGIGVRNPQYGVGKVIGADTWVHKNYEDVFPRDVIEKAKELIPAGFTYVAVRYNKKTNDVAFIDSPDFDVADEPIVGGAYKVTADGKITYTKMPSNPLIWHHKWCWVKDDYKGFNVEDSMKRSIEWKTILGVDKNMTARIGRLSFWKENVIPLLKNR